MVKAIHAAAAEPRIPVPTLEPAYVEAVRRRQELGGELDAAEKELRRIRARLGGGQASAVDAAALKLLGDPTADQRAELVTTRESVEGRLAVLRRAVDLAEAKAAEVKARRAAELGRQAWEETYLPLGREAALAYLAFVAAARKASGYVTGLIAAGMGAHLGSGVPVTAPLGMAAGVIQGLMAGGWRTRAEVGEAAPELFANPFTTTAGR